MNKVPGKARTDYPRRNTVASWFSTCISMVYAVLIMSCLSGGLIWLSSVFKTMDWPLVMFAAIFGTVILAGFAVSKADAITERASEYAERHFLPGIVSSLPAKEVLLRSSQASPASPEELLRPATDQETAAEELLRASETGGYSAPDG